MIWSYRIAEAVANMDRQAIPHRTQFQRSLREPLCNVHTSALGTSNHHYNAVSMVFCESSHRGVRHDHLSGITLTALQVMGAVPGAPMRRFLYLEIKQFGEIPCPSLILRVAIVREKDERQLPGTRLPKDQW